MGSSTPVANADNTTVFKHLIQFNPSSQLPIKLSGNHNFTTWKAQIAMLLHGHDLYGHLDGSTPSPPTTVTINNRETPNPEYKDWFRQDTLIQNALMASVDATIASTVAFAANSKSAWDQLHTSFANKSQTRIFSLRHHLSRVTKDTKSIAEYLREIRSLSDELATGSLVANEELVVKILSGLGPEF
uniref:Retrotransposon Copia-like N-terminal domain-containing protein n=1 Tax=Nicotiana tabacum TaxID=4097 RepID=A0A1S4C6N1_TOBAC